MSDFSGTDWKDDDEEFSDSEEYDEKFVANKFSSVLIIDNTDKMFEVIEDDENDNCYFKMCLISILNTLEKNFFKRFYHNLAVICLYEKDALVEFNNDLKNTIKKLNMLKYKSNDELKDMFGCKPGNDACVHESMHNAVVMFKKNDKLFKNSHKHVAILTNESLPKHCDNDDKCTVTIEEFVTFKIELVVLPLIDDFKWSSYYFKLLKRVKENETVEIDELTDQGHVDDDLSNVISELIQTNTNVLRTIFRYGDSSYFHVHVKKFVSAKKFYHQIKVNPKNGQRVKKQTQQEQQSDEYKPYLSENDIKKRSHITLPVGITLLYVSNKRSSIHYLQHDLFLMLEDDQVERNGPDVLFDYFHEFCTTKNKVLICTYNKGYVKQKDYLIELTPDRYKGKACFIGQYLCHADSAKNYTPYANKALKVDPNAVETTCDLIKKLTVRNDKAMHFSDPKFDYKSALIKGHLLSDKNAPWEEPDDVPPQFPSQDDVSERIGEDLSETFRLTCLPQGELKRKRGKQ